MNTAYLTALSALAGSVVGGLTAGFTTWLSLRSAVQESRHAADLANRQDLFRDFVIAASKAYGNALVSEEPQIQEFVALYGMISRMRILCSPVIVACAEKIMSITIDTNLAPNKTLRELHEMLESETVMDPLKEFSKLARAELDAFAP